VIAFEIADFRRTQIPQAFQGGLSGENREHTKNWRGYDYPVVTQCLGPTTAPSSGWTQGEVLGPF